MEGVNGLDAGVILPLRKELDENNGVPYTSSKVDYHLNNLIASHLSKPDLTPQEIADASRATAEAAVIAAKAARATAVEKAAAAARAVAAAKSALALIASFPKHRVVQDVSLERVNHVASDLSSSKNEELPSVLQLGDVNGIISNSSSSCEHRNDQCEVPSERPNTEQARVDSNGVGMEIDSDRLVIESAGGEEAKEGTQVNRKRGRPKSK